MQHLSALGQAAEARKAAADALGLRVALMCVLLGVGFCLAAFALPLGELWVGQQYGSSFSRSIASREYVDAAALPIRSVGFMLFAAGLVERILIHFGK